MSAVLGVRSAGEVRTRASLRTATVAAILIAIVGGSLFGAVQISRAVARSASDLHAADEAARSGAVVRSHLALAANGSEAQQTLSISEANTALAEYRLSLRALEDNETAAAVIETGTQYADEAEVALIAVPDGLDTQDGVDALFRSAMATLDQLRRELAGEIDVIDSSYNVLGIALGLATAGLAPLVLILWARSSTRRSMEWRELSMKLEHEEALNEARNEMMRTVVHELRTPLTGISGLARVLGDPAIRDSREADEFIDMIRMEAEDMTLLTDDILASAGLEAGKLEVHIGAVDACDAATQTLSIFESRGIEIEMRCEPGTIAADDLRLRQILKNLVSNAVKYGGDPIVVEGKVDGENYLYRVTDHGPGVPLDIEQRLFTPFPHQGTGSSTNHSVGLGLAIVRELAQAMGGDASYAREAGASSFSLRLPLSYGPDSVEDGDVLAETAP